MKCYFSLTVSPEVINRLEQLSFLIQLFILTLTVDTISHIVLSVNNSTRTVIRTYCIVAGGITMTVVSGVGRAFVDICRK